MNEQTVALTKEPTRGDFYVVKDTAQQPCECTAEMKLMFKETGVSCKSCAARQILNGMVKVAEEV